MPRKITIVDALALLRSRADLRESGMSDRAISKAVADGILKRVRHGWYITRQDWSNLWPEGKHLVHIVAVHRDTGSSGPVFCGVSAAVLHGYPLYRHTPEKVHVLVTGGRHVSSVPDVMRHEGRIAADDIVSIDGMLVTSPARTVVDVARTLGLEASVSIADASLRAAAVSRNVQNDERAAAWREELSRQLRSAAGLRGVRNARWVMEFADGRAQLPGESVSRLQFHRLGVRHIDLQVRVAAPNGGNFWIDFDLLDFDTFGEFDGKTKYTDEALRSHRTIEEVLLDEKRREDWIRGTTGRRVIRWGDEHSASANALRRRLRSFGLILPH